MHDIIASTDPAYIRVYAIVYTICSPGTWAPQEREVSIHESYDEVIKEYEKILHSDLKYTPQNLILKARDLRFGEGLWS